MNLTDRRLWEKILVAVCCAIIISWIAIFVISPNTHEYSSPLYHGDSSHNNALAINGAKSYIASII